MSNIYEKITNVSYELQTRKIKKSGVNKFVGYTYYELADFLPPILELTRKEKLFLQFTYNTELATLKIINTEKPEEVLDYTSPMAATALKGAHDIQNLGAEQTYSRRYLLMSAFHIVENDYFDAMQGEREQLIADIIEISHQIMERKGYTKEQLCQKFNELKKLKQLSIPELRNLKQRMENFNK